MGSSESDVDQLESLARCPENSDSCNVNNYKGLSVDDLDKLDEVLGTLIAKTGCAKDPTDAPTNAPAPTECTARPEIDWARDSHCKKCKWPNNTRRWPCNKNNPRICE